MSTTKMRPAVTDGGDTPPDLLLTAFSRLSAMLERPVG
jgi:hypothetical protein